MPLRLPWTRRPGAVPPAPRRAYTPPAAIDLVYDTLLDKLTFLERNINSLDTKAGVLIGATAAAFGLVATSGGGRLSLLLECGFLRGLGLVILARAFSCLIRTVFVRDIEDAPDPLAALGRANESEADVKEQSLEAMATAHEIDRASLDTKSRWTSRGQLALGEFVALVVFSAMADYGARPLRRGRAPALRAGRRQLPGQDPATGGRRERREVWRMAHGKRGGAEPRAVEPRPPAPPRRQAYVPPKSPEGMRVSYRKGSGAAALGKLAKAGR